MRNFFLLFTIITCSLNISAQKPFCDSALIDEVSNYRMKDGAVFMREYTVMLDSIGTDSVIPEERYSVVLLANVIYRFVIKDSPKCNCEGKLSIADMHNKSLISSNYQKGKKAEQFDIMIKETGAHLLKFSFRNGETGCAVVGMYYVKNTKLGK